MIFSKIFKNLPEVTLDESKKKILLIYILILVLIFGLYFYFFLNPSLAKLAQIIPEAHVLRAEIRLVKSDLNFEDKLKERLRVLGQTMEKYENKLSREKEIPMLLENLSKIAKSSKVKILSITPIDKALKGQQGAGAKKDIYQEVPIIITAQSGYHELGIFINKLETDERYMQVSDIEIRSGKANPKRHDMEFIVNAYTFKKE
ncbi:MAG: type 4a pilus biogenesis protein PilO [Candidatus Omnitrophica bacterium]|nr:type 4a pilus biogenesis protein PilO [Candidatus Omnitrophota bacterium]